MKVTIHLARDGNDSMPEDKPTGGKEPTQLSVEVENKLVDKGLLPPTDGENLKWMQLWWTWPST